MPVADGKFKTIGPQLFLPCIAISLQACDCKTWLVASVSAKFREFFLKQQASLYDISSTDYTSRLTRMHP